MRTSFLFHTRPSRKLWLAGLAVGALVAAGIAIAGPGNGSTTQIAGPTFSATSVTDYSAETCTGPDAYEFTHATYTGTATGGTDTHLDGTIVLDVKSAYDTTTNRGWLKANVEINSATAGQHAHGHLTAVNVNGTLQGLLTGDEGAPGSKLLANVSAVFARGTTGGFSSGSIGTGSGANTAIVTTGACKAPEGPKPDHPKPDHPKPPKH